MKAHGIGDMINSLNASTYQILILCKFFTNLCESTTLENWTR